jgi:squalene cyclase
MSATDRGDKFLRSAYAFIDEHPEEWKLEYDVDLEVLNHVLRVRIQDGSINQHVSHVRALCQIQHDDGGWGDTRDDPVSRLRSTAFCTQMLLRANRVLKDDSIATTIKRALQFILEQQEDNGGWRDHKWHFLDATSVSVGTLLFAVNEPTANEDQRQALQRGMDFIVSQQHSNGLWYYRPTASPVTITAHLLQKCATFGSPEPVIVPAVKQLLALQAAAGHWDQEHIDHTCDATRCLMLSASTDHVKLLGPAVLEASGRAVGWLLDSVSDGGLGDRPGQKPHVERTCDGIDTLLKFRRFQSQHEMLAFWR